jgi:hypothetical protein
MWTEDELLRRYLPWDKLLKVQCPSLLLNLVARLRHDHRHSGIARILILHRSLPAFWALAYQRGNLRTQSFFNAMIAISHRGAHFPRNLESYVPKEPS